MSTILKFLLCILCFCFISCSDDNSSRGKNSDDIKKCEPNESRQTEFNQQDEIVRVKYNEWFSKYQHTKDMNTLVFAAGRLVESLLINLNSNLSENEVNNILDDLISVTVDKLNRKLKMLTPNDFSKIRKLLTTKNSNC